MEQIAPNFTLPNENNASVSLYDYLAKGPVMLVFYPGDFTPVCTKQLCDYQENMDKFTARGIQVLGISADDPEKHQKFIKKFGFTFPLLTDPGKKIAKLYDCKSAFMLGAVSRAIVLINQRKEIVYRYKEPIAITRRESEELLGEVDRLIQSGLLQSKKNL